MDKKVLIVFALVSLHISESRILPRSLPEDESSGNGEMSINSSEKDRKLGIGPGIFDPSGGVNNFDIGAYDYDSGVNKPQHPPTDYDFGKPEDDNGNDINKPDKKPERFPSDEDHWEPPLKRPIDKDEDDAKKYDEEKPIEENDDSSKDDNLPPEENNDKPIHSDGDDSNAGEETVKKEDNDEESEEKGEDEDKKDYIPDDEENGDKLPEDENEEPEEHDKDENEEPEEHDKDENEEPEEHDKDESSDEKPFDGEEAGFFESGGSIFDTPFFNLEQVKKYFSTLDRALGHVFRQTMDEARLLNGTYANTTEEEVEINGKKYIVQKSVIQGADNHSSIYVEALSSKPQLNDTEETKSNEITNSTEV